MPWLVLSYSLPAQPRSSPRVAVWRRLKQLGAVAVPGGAQVLPDRPECAEAFQWLGQEIRQAQGQAVVMRVETLSGLTDSELIDLFHAAAAAGYAELEPELKQLERTARGRDPARLVEPLERLRRKHAALAQVDYFASPASAAFSGRLASLQRALAPDPPAANPSAALADYRDRRWMTRPHPHVDRLACVWLIRHFINPEAPIRYGAAPDPGEVTFDLEPADFGHQGQWCSFETMQHAFGLDDPALRALAEIVHDIDLQTDDFGRPETRGVAAVLDGWRRSSLDDAELETRGLALFDGLHAALMAAQTPTSPPPSRRPSKARD
jgi:hypothetical protein